MKLSGKLLLEQFNYAVATGEGKKVVNGIPTDENVPVKFLILCDPPDPATGQSALNLMLTFRPAEFEQFIAFLSGSKIIAAREMPRITAMKLPKLSC